MICVSVALLAWNLILNAFRLSAIRRYYEKFKSGEKDLLEYEPSIERLLEKAGANEYVDVGRTIGPIKASRAIEVYGCKGRVDDCFKRAIGVYRFRCKNAFNPLYIVEFPVRLMLRAGFPKSAKTRTVLSVLFWCIGFIFGYFLELLLDLTVREVLFQALGNILK